jgi:RNA polymerase sigma-70 factor (ECF subfamily)
VPALADDLFERHHLAIYRYLLRMTGSREDAEDLTQEVFLRVVKASHDYEERSRERGWLFRIARNLRNDRSRHEQRVPVTSPLQAVEIAEPARQELCLSLSRALHDLDENDRESFLLAEVGGLSYADIALVCDVTPAAVRSRIYRARLGLKVALESPIVRERVLARGSHG